jgi:hypothetical protein
VEKITFLLNRTVKRIEFTISHWAEVAHFILRHIDNAFDRAAASIEYSVQLVTEDIATTVCKAIMRIGYYFTSKDNDGANLKATISNSVKALETHYQNDRCVIANEIPFKFRHIENDSESMRCRYFKPVKLGELDSITIGNTTKKLKDWLYTEL